MGICYLQHRVATGTYNQTAKRVSRLKTYPSMLSLLFGGWLQFPKPCFTAFFLIWYYYIILITLGLGMTVGLPIPCINKLNQLNITMSKEIAVIFSIRVELNVFFMLILRFLFERKSFVAKRLHKLVRFKSKSGYISIFAAFFSFGLVVMNLLLIIICYPGILNPGPVITGMFQNVRGFVPFSTLNEPVLPLSTTKLQDFQSYVFGSDPGLVVLNETWLSNDHFDNEILPDRAYKIFRLDRSAKTHPFVPHNPQKFRKRGGGILIAVKSNLNIESKQVGRRVKAEILSVEMKCGNDIFCITTCYRVGTLQHENFMEVEKHLRSIARIKKYKKHYFFGDLNLSNISWPVGSTTVEIEQKFVELFDELGMQQMIDVPTHQHGKTLDLCYVSNASYIKNINVLSKDEICSSDHYGVTFELTSRAKSNISKRKIYDFKRANWSDLNRDLNSVPWDRYIESCDPNEGWGFFRNTLNRLMVKHIPTITIKDEGRPPWFDSEVINLGKKKGRLHKKYKDTGTPADYARYSQCRKKLKLMIEEKMESNLNDDDNDPALLSKKFWGHLKSTSKSTRIPESVYYNSRHRNNPRDQAILFNRFFADQFSDSSLYDIDIEWDNDDTNNIDFSLSKIRKLLHQVKPRKAPGPDGIHGMVLKNCAFGLAYPLSMLFRVSYNTGIIPVEWKLANVVPVHKKGTKADVENYRPISLTCLIMKIFEKIVRDEILLKCKSVLNPNQHGFLPAKSCETQMINFTESLTCSLNNNVQTDVVYFDFSKAFDSVNHDILLKKLKNEFGLNGRLLKFLADYLHGREQCVIIGGQKSERRIVTSGVPQGSILGPLLFVLFINDMAMCVSDKTNIALYADDTKIWREIIDWEDHLVLQNDINQLQEWANVNKMNFHPQKCKVLSVAKHSYNPILPFHVFFYELGGTILEYTNSEKDLGVIVNTTLSSDDQCLARYNMMNSKLGLLMRVCHFTKNVQQKRALYLAIVRSQLNHCCVVWRPTSEPKINKLESVQRRAVKWILNEQYHHYSDLEYTCRLRDLKLLPIKYFFILNDLIIFHKIYSVDSYCVSLPSYFRPFNDNDRGRLRSNVNPPDFFNSQRSTLDLSSMRAMSHDDKSLKCTLSSVSVTFRNSFFFRGHMLWNHLPLKIREEVLPSRFKALLQPHLWDLVMRPD